MRDYSPGELLFRLIFLVVLSSVESFNWAAQPTNPTLAIKGQDVSLMWNYSLTADELLQSQTQFLIFWKKLNQLTSNYDQIGSKSFFQVIGDFTYLEPRSPHIVIDRNDSATLHIKDVRRGDEGTYKIEFTLKTDGSVLADQEVNLTVLERPELDYASNDQDVCEGSMVTLHCNATGKPTPNLNWTRVWENGSDSEQLPVVDGSYVMSNIKGSSNGTYRCTAYNGVGDPVNRTVKVIVGYSASVVRVVKSSDTVIEGYTFSLTCEVSGYPMPIVTWITVSNDERRNGNKLNFTNITRDDTGDYRCEAENRCGKEIRNESINVFYQPDMVTLVTNTTENKDCSDLWVNFTCISSEGNPPVYNYLLSGDEDGFNFSKSGTWIERISRGGEAVYNCLAYQLVGNVTSSNNITLTVNVPISINQPENKIVKEGDNVEVYCNATGSPDPTVIWRKVQGGGYNPTEGKQLTITNITRAQAGKYNCTANNTCGEESTVMDIDVQYQPENVSLTTNTTSNVCTGVAINFTCTAEANPAVHTYLLYENDTAIKNMGMSGTGIKTIENAGQFVFRCEANNSVQGIGKSGDTILTVDVPASLEQVENEVVTEGDNVEVYCNVTAGIPEPTVLWTKVATGEHIKGNPLNITSINQAQDGEYRCTANNTCGEESIVVDIDVQHKPDDVQLTKNATNKVCEGIIINFTCSAEANPAVHTYLLYENDTVIRNMGLGTVIKTMENAGEFVFRCEANNSIQGSGRSVDTILTVHAPAAIVKQAENKSAEERDNVVVYCNVSGIPDPTVIWKNVETGEIIKGNLLNITNITRAQAGEYRCTANNTCGEESTVANIDVKYPPTVTREGHIIDVTEGDPASISCAVRGNPQPNITWYKGNDTSSGTMINTNSILEFPETVLNDSGWYTCFAENCLGNVTVTVQLRVAKLVPSTPSTSSKPTTKESTIYASATIDKSCDERLDVKKRFPSLACKRVSHLGCFSAQAVDSRCGSGVIVDFEMKFNQSAVASEVLNVLKTAAKEDNFDGFKVDPNSIEQISPPPTGTSGTKKPICNEFFKKEDCSMNWVPLAIIAVVGVIVISAIVGVIGWWVHKRRKCRKDTRVHSSASEEQPFSRENNTPSDDNPYSRVNNGYAQAGPRPSELTDMEQHQGTSGPATVPNYAVVDKPAKKASKKDKKVEEQKPAAEPQYALVDKSKKKKKGEPEATYAQVDMSKKSKKKPKPGEVLYADLGEFHQMQELPAVSTSPQALPPIKKPAPYVETQYADITQFLKGDATLPDSNNSQGPATGTQNAPVPESNNSQEPATSTKEESQASNTGGDGEPGHNTNF